MEQPLPIDLGQFMNALDIRSRKIVWHLRRHGHGRLTELTGLIGASTDMETLFRLKEVINPAAARILGRPLVEFNKSRIDPETGKRVLFNWWMADFAEDDQPAAVKGEKPLIDVFDEEDQIIIVSEVSPSLKLSDKAKIEQRHGILSITLDKI